MAAPGARQADSWPDLDVAPARRTGLAPALLALGLVALIAAVVLPLLRQEGARSWATIWAEDGAVYFQQARDDGGFDTVLRGYAGYLQLPPRVLGALSLLVPIRSLALYFALAAGLVNAALAWFTYWASAGWVKGRPVRLTLSGLVVLMPALGLENTATITNTIWTFAMVAPWALVSLREKPVDAAIRAFVAFLAATATVISAVFIPLALGHLYFRRTRASATVTAAYFAGLALQGAVVVSTTDEATALPALREPARLAELLGTRLFAEYLLGGRAIAALWPDHATLVASAPAVAVAVGLGLLAWHVRHRRRVVLAGALALLAVVAYALTVWSRGTNAVLLTEADVRALFPSATPPVEDLDRVYVAAQLRYSVVPVHLLASAAAVLVSGVVAGSRRRAAQVVRGIFVAHVVVLVVAGFAVTTGRSASPTWTDGVDEAFDERCSGVGTGASVLIQTSQLGSFPVELTCRELSP